MSRSRFRSYGSIFALLAIAGCEDQSKRMNDHEIATCKSKICDVSFSALVFSGSGPIVIKIPGERFLRIDGRTSDEIIRRFVFIRNNDDLNYTAYEGRLDGDIVWSAPVAAKVILISDVRDMRQLPETKAAEIRAWLSR